MGTKVVADLGTNSALARVEVGPTSVADVGAFVTSLGADVAADAQLNFTFRGPA